MNTSKVDKVLVLNSAGVASLALVNSGAAGSYAVLVEGKAVNAVVTKDDVFSIAVKQADGSVKHSDKIKAKNIVSLKVEDYRAATLQKATYTFANTVEGEEYTFIIVDKSDKEIFQYRQNKRSYNAVAGATPATLASAFAAQINADKAANVTASATADALTITAKARVVSADATGQFGEHRYFEVASYLSSDSGKYTKAGSAVYVKPAFGSGSFADVRTMEQDSIGYEGGSLNKRLFPVVAPFFQSLPGNTYDIVVIEYDNKYWGNTVASGIQADPIVLVVPVKAGTNKDILVTSLANFS